MRKTLLKTYKPPEVDVLKVQVELGFYGTYNPPSGSGGGVDTPDDPLYGFGTFTQDMPGADL